jgi:3-oxocholest-4-en-26-oate---CoA ligase
MPWSFGEIYDAIGRVSVDEHPALIHAGENGAEGTVTSWPEFSTRTNRLARYLQNRGLEPGAKVAHYMRNCPEYVETMVASFKGRFVHVNVNYRYLDDELHYIMDNSDAEAVVFAAGFRPQVEALAPRLPKVKCWLEVASDNQSFSDHELFIDYDDAVSSGDGSELTIERSGQDLLFIYTGGTTGMPKGVMWEHEAIWNAGGGGASLLAPGGSPPTSPEEHAQRVAAAPLRPRLLAACPLMHGTAMLSAINVLNQGGCVVTTPESSLAPEALWNTVARYKVNTMAIVGDAFAKPLLKELDEHAGAYDISSMKGMISSGVMWSPEVKQGLLEHNENMVLVDSFGASEAVGFGASRTSKDEREARSAKFQIGEHCKVFTEDHREVVPGSGEPGFIARAGAIPVGYYKDPEKTAKTFPTIDGVRYSVPGDWCTVEADGTLTLLGRGSVCINSGGEKIYPEEIEEVLKRHPSVDDALVVGVPDERWGQAVTGVVHLTDGATLEEEALRGHVKGHLAAYKAPKRILESGVPLRAANGKADYKGVTEYAVATLAPE